MQLFNRRGYTIDQTILIVAIIAILITLVIITLGWTLLSRTSGSKLGAFTDQIAQATNVYYGDNHVFPSTLDQMDTEGLVKFRKSGTNYYHDIGGASGLVTMAQVALTAAQATSLGLGAGAGTYLVSQFTLVPPAEANEADKSVDGTNGALGHFVITNGTNTCTAANMAAAATTQATATTTVCYIGEKVS